MISSLSALISCHDALTACHLLYLIISPFPSPFIMMLLPFALHDTLSFNANLLSYCSCLSHCMTISFFSDLLSSCLPSAIILLPQPLFPLISHHVAIYLIPRKSYLPPYSFPLTPSLLPLTSSHISPLISSLSPLTSHPSPLSSSHLSP